MFLQTVMLLLREECLDSCPQECWSVYPATIRNFLGTPSNRMLFCGMSIGYRNPDHPVNALRTERAPLGAFATFHGT
jgi:nitroreductase